MLRDKSRESSKGLGPRGPQGVSAWLLLATPEHRPCLSLGGEGGKGATGCMAEEECGEQGWVTP